MNDISNEELDICMGKLMGWHTTTFDERKRYAKERSENPHLFDGLAAAYVPDSPGTLTEVWHTDHWYSKDGKIQISLGKFQPSTDLNQAMECALEISPDMEDAFNLQYYSSKFFVLYIYGFGGGKADKDPARAVCLALKAFIESKEE